MSKGKGEELTVEKARVVLVGFEKDKDKYSVAKSLSKELGSSFEEAQDLCDTIPVEIIQPVPIVAAENLAERLRVSGAVIEVVPLSREMGGGKTCYRHPHKLAIAKCKSCGRPLCATCLLESKRKLYCKDHYKYFKLWRFLRAGGISALILSLIVIWLVFHEAIIYQVRRALPVSTAKVALVVFSLEPDTTQARFYNDLMLAGTGGAYKEGDTHQLSDIDGWFQYQYQNLTNENKTDVIDMDVYGLFDVDDPPPGFNILGGSEKNISDYVKNLAERNNFSLSAYDYYLFVYLTETSPVELDYMENLGVYDEKFGLYVYPSYRTYSEDYYVMGLAHLMAKMMGAKVKLDDKGFPIFPEGYAQPNISPLYPQPGAELMGCYIPQQKFTIYRINSMDDVLVGPQTAYELGWVPRGIAKNAYKGLR